MTFRQALSSMCYREVEPGHWLKPVGTLCFEFREVELVWYSWFKSMPGDLLVWERRDLSSFSSDGEKFLRKLKECEAFSTVNKTWEANSQFQLAPEPRYTIEAAMPPLPEPEKT